MGDQVVPVEPLPRGAVNSDDRRDISRLARSEEGKRVALMAVGDLVSDFIGHGGQQTRDNVARILSEVEEQLPGEAQTPAQPQTGFASAPADDYDIPPDVAALLDEPDEEDEEEDLPPAAVVEEEDDEDQVDYSDGEYVDPEIRKLQARLAKSEKRAEHEHKLRVQASASKWEDEAKRVFRLGPLELLSDEELKSITATSRKDFLRQAKSIADRNRSVAERFGATFQPTPAPAVDTRRQDWGTPPAGAPSAQPESIDKQERLARARRSGNLTGIIKAHLYGE